MTRRNAIGPCGSGQRYKHCCGAAPPARAPVTEGGSEAAAPRPVADGPVAASGVLIEEGFLSDDECAAVLAAARDRTMEPAQIYAPDEGQGAAATSQRHSSERVTTLIKTGAIGEVVVPVIGRAFQERASRHFSVEFEWPDILCYGPGGLFAMRADAEMYEAGHGWRRTDDRDYSLLVYLSDGFTGGELEFPRHGVTIRPRAGMLVIFPSDHRHVHLARAVETGGHEVLVSWGAVAGSPRVHAEPRHRVVYTSRQHLPGEAD